MKENSSSSYRLCIIIPTYNNAGTIRQVVVDACRICANVIVVNDGSTDDTSEILTTLPSTTTVVSYAKNKGKGHALVEGFRKAKELGIPVITEDEFLERFGPDAAGGQA